MPRNYVRNKIGEFATSSGGPNPMANAFKPRPEGKHTQASVGKAIADPAKPIAPAGPTPKTYTASTHPGGRAGFLQSIKQGPSAEEQKRFDDFHNALKNDPAHHANVAKSLNADRVTRRLEAKAGE